MARPSFNSGDYGAIAVGGALGASLRWLVGGTNAPVDYASWFSKPTSGVWIFFGNDVSSSTGIGTSTQTLELVAGVPGDTLAVNLVGCFLLGALTLLLVRSSNIPRRLLVGAATGFCGSLTTFSTFAVEVATLLRGKPASLPAELRARNISFERHLPNAYLYLALSLAGGALAFWIGRSLANRIVTPPRDITTGDAS